MTKLIINGNETELKSLIKETIFYKFCFVYNKKLTTVCLVVSFSFLIYR